MTTKRRAISLDLPYPPSVNHYWRRVGSRTLISREGRRFRERVASRVALQRVQPLAGALDVQVHVHPPDNRRRDLDNLMKSLLDALEHGDVYEDDSQIDHLDIRRGEVVPHGNVIVCITEGQRHGTARLPA